MENAMQLQWFLFGLICAIFYGYVGLDFDSDPESCIATAEYDKRVVLQGSAEDWENSNVDMSIYIDVASRYDHVFDAAFFMSFLLVVTGLLHMIFRTRHIRLPLRVIAALA